MADLLLAQKKVAAAGSVLPNQSGTGAAERVSEPAEWE